MKKNSWHNPQITSLGVSNTTDATPLAPNPDAKNIKCLICNKVFSTGALYEAHKVWDGDLGTECPSAPKGDGILQAEMVQVS